MTQKDKLEIILYNLYRKYKEDGRVNNVYDLNKLYDKEEYDISDEDAMLIGRRMSEDGLIKGDEWKQGMLISLKSRGIEYAESLDEKNKRFNVYLEVDNGRFNLFNIENLSLQKVVNAYKKGLTKFTIDYQKYSFDSIEYIGIYKNEKKLNEAALLKLAGKSNNRTLTSYILDDEQLKLIGANVTKQYLKDEEFGYEKAPYLEDKKVDIFTGSQNEKDDNKLMVFISHSTKDKEIVSVFVDKILKLILKIDSENIFCTSLHESSIRSGADFRLEIKKHLAKAKLIIQIITNNYKEGEVCLNEMGAAWALDNKVVEFILPPISYDSVGFIHEPDQLIKLNVKEDVLKFIGEEKTDNNKIKPVEIERHVNEFLEIIKDKIGKQPISKAAKTEIKNANELGLADNDIVEIENREGLYLFKNGKLKHILDDSGFSLYVYGLDKEEVKSIKHSDAINIIDRKNPIPSLYNCQILIDDLTKKSWLLVDNERRFLPDSTCIKLMTKVKSENMSILKHKDLMDIPEGDKLRASTGYSA